MLHEHGFLNIQTREHTLEYKGNTTEGQLFYENMRNFFHTILPFMKKWIRVPDDYETIYQQALQEILQSDFVARWQLLTAWAITPAKKAKLSMTERH